MFLMENKTKENKITSLYEVEDTILFQLGENKYASKGSYFIHLEKREQFNNQIIVNRSAFKIDDKEVEKKFPKISNLYFSSVFPLILTYHEGNYLIAEYKETAKRIMEHDQNIRSNYSGNGLEHIRDQFLAKVKNQTDFQRFIEPLPIYQVLNISATPKFKKEQSNFKWNIAGLGIIDGNGKFELDSETNKMNFILEQTDKSYLMELLMNYISENEISMSFNENENPEINFTIETIYNDSLNSIQNAKAELQITVGEKFKYAQTFFLTLSPKNN